MKFYIATIIVAFISPLSSYAQLNAKFGDISKEEAAMKLCSFDPEASAVVLLDEGHSDYADDNGLITFYHHRVKILKESGLDNADISLSFYSDGGFERIDRVEAMTINIEDNGTRNNIPVENKSIYTKKLNKYRSEVTFAFPEVKVGSILELKYVIRATSYSALRDWEFQQEIPVLQSRYKLNIVPGREISYLVQYNPQYKVDVKNEKVDPSITFTMNNIPGLTDEPFMDARQDYIQKVVFATTKYAGHVGAVNYMSTWKEVTRELMSRSDFGKQLRIDIDECKSFIETELSGKSDSAKIQAIHHYVATNVKWNGVHSLVSEDGIRNLWKKKTGNSAEINLLLVNLLKSANLDAYPMLVSERGHGKINKDQPFVSQFSDVYAVVFSGGKKYYVDATDHFTPIHLTPYSILNSTAFIADNKVGGLIDISSEEMRHREYVNIAANLNGEGQLSGSVNLESRDYARTEKLRNYSNHKTDYVDYYLKRSMANIAVENFKIQNEGEESKPFTQSFDFKFNVQSTGDYSLINFNMFTGLESNPFIQNNRFSNINLGYKKSLNLRFIVNVPDNYKVDALPKNIQLVNPDRSITFTRQLFHEKNQIVAIVRLDVNKSVFNINEYPQVKDFYKQMVNLLNEQIVLKK